MNIRLSLILLALFFLPQSIFATDHLQWVKRTNVGSPGKRAGSAMAYDEAQQVIVLFGGRKYNGLTSGVTDDPLRYYTNDLWKYDGVQWTEISVTGTKPPIYLGYTMCFHPVLQTVVMYDRSAGSGPNGHTMWQFIFDTPTTGHWSIVTTVGPQNNTGVTMAYDYNRSVLVLMGAGGGQIVGQSTTPGVETWEWDMNSWTRKADAPMPSTDFPFRLEMPVLGYHAASRKMMMVDDYATQTSALTDPSRVFLYDGTKWFQATTNNLAPPLGLRYMDATRQLVYDPSRERLVAVGSTASYDFDGVNWRVAGPSSNFPNGPGQAGGMTRLRGFSTAFDKRRNVMVRFGGAAPTTVTTTYDNVAYYTYDETWELTPNIGYGVQRALPAVAPPPGPLGVIAYCELESMTLHFLVSVASSSSQGIEYRWFKDNKRISPPATHPWLYVKNFVTTADTGVYYAEAIDDWGLRVRSDDAPIFIYEHAEITQQPQSRRLIPGESFALRVAYNSTLPVSVTWTKDKVIIPGANSLTYSRSNVTLADAGEYRAIIQSYCSAPVSQPAVISVGPRIVTQPEFPANPGAGNAPVTMSVGGDGAGALTGTYLVGADPTAHAQRAAPDDATNPRPMSFTWRFEGTPISNGSKYTITKTSTTSSLQINKPDYEDEGRYDCVVTDASGSAYAKTTNTSTLLLNPLAPPYLTIQQGRGPDPRREAAMVYDSQRGRTVLFGGECYGINPRSGSANPQLYQSNDTFEWDGQVWIKRNPATRPPAMKNFGMVYDSFRGRTVLFGGQKYAPPAFFDGTQTITNDVWEWDGVNWTQITPPSSPPARTLPVMCFDTVRRETLMIGGSTLSPEPADYYGSRKILWAWNGTQWKQRGIMPNGNGAPYMNAGNTFAFDQQRGVASVFGGFGDNENPVWEWNGASWNRVLPPLDYRITNSGTPFYDPVRRMISMSIIGNSFSPGYQNGTSFLACWDGSRFVRGSTSVIDDITGTAPPFGEEVPNPTHGDMSAFDTQRRCLVWFDNAGIFLNSGTPPSTREMHFSAKAKPVHLPLEVFFSETQNIRMRVISAGQRPLSYQWFKGGKSLVDDAQLTGVTAGTLIINNITAAHAGLYSVRITNAMNQVFTQNMRLNVQPDGIATAVQGAGLVLSWSGATGILESAPAPNGPWTPIYGVSSPHTVAMDEELKFFRVRY